MHCIFFMTLFIFLYFITLNHHPIWTIYGPRSQFLTVHLHTHLNDQVIQHGCLSMTSCFPRQAYLGLALNLCHGTKYVLEQFTTWYLIDRSLSEVNEIIVDDIFINEKFNDQNLHMDVYENRIFTMMNILLSNITVDIHVVSSGFSPKHILMLGKPSAIEYLLSMRNVVERKRSVTARLSFSSTFWMSITLSSGNIRVLMKLLRTH